MISVENFKKEVRYLAEEIALKPKEVQVGLPKSEV